MKITVLDLFSGIGGFHQALFDVKYTPKGSLLLVDETIKTELYKYWTEGDIVEMLGVISLFGYLNRWNDSMGTVVEDGAIESGEKYLGKTGWEIGKHK